jgi:hypothetical protein
MKQEIIALTQRFHEAIDMINRCQSEQEYDQQAINFHVKQRSEIDEQNDVTKRELHLLADRIRNMRGILNDIAREIADAAEEERKVQVLVDINAKDPRCQLNNRHVLTATSLSAAEFTKTLELAIKIKANPEEWAHAFERKTLLMLFQKPSLRTRVSFETGMTKMGGHAIFYSVADSPLGVKETIADTAHVLERMVDVVMARLNKRQDIREFAANSKIPVINALDDFAHPCQMLADFQTILEHRKTLKGTVLAYFGDVANNVTYDLMRSCALLGLECRCCGPADAHYGTFDGISIEFNPLSLKANFRIFFSFESDPIFTSERVLTPKKHSSPIISTLDGISTDFKMVSLNANFPISLNIEPVRNLSS